MLQAGAPPPRPGNIGRPAPVTPASQGARARPLPRSTSARPMARPLLLLVLACALAAPDAHAQRARRPAARRAPRTTPTVLQDTALARRYAATITPEDLAAHLYFYASDELEGRDTGSRGQKVAAKYLATVYRRLGVAPRGNAPGADPRAPERYFQPVPTFAQRLTGATFTAMNGAQTTLAATYGPGAQNQHVLANSGNGASACDVVFAGYGIQDAAWDDLAALPGGAASLAGKCVVMLEGEPMQGGKSLVAPDSAATRWSRSRGLKTQALYRAMNLLDERGRLRAGANGPAAIVTVSDLASGAEAFAGNVARSAARVGGGLSITRPEMAAAMPATMSVSTAFADALLAPSGKTVAGLQAEIAAARRPVAFAVAGGRLTSSIERTVAEGGSENVAAFIEGSDAALKDEVVIVSAHLDHIGISPNAQGDTINNGADDDGSGTVALLEMAEAFMKAKADGFGPRRSVLFLHVTGEEKGLLGSAYYADVDPLVPLASTVTNLNIDMIGRFDPTEPNKSENYVYVIGSNLISRELDSLNTVVNVAIGSNVELSQRFNSADDPNRFYARSDHANFGKKGIPFIFYFTGTHADYHRPGDEPQKIEYPRMARITRLVFGTAWQVANQDRRPAVSGTGFN